MSEAVELVRYAIINKKQITCYYDGFYREMCPHVLGWKNGVRHVLSYQFAGASRRGLPSGGQWRCMEVGAMLQASTKDGPWYTGDRHTQPQTCVDEVDVVVAF